VTITGRVGREASFKQIKTGLMAKFPLAEHSVTDGNAKTTWHTICAFGKTAEALRGTVAKGQMLTIAGYPHERTISNPKTGMEKIVTEIYLAGAIKHHK
jgi:single-stranded DNA-binding protein